jgi:hypothetical protein
MRITLFFIVVLVMVLGVFPARAQQEAPPIQAPETIQEAQEFGLGILKALPDAVKKVWQEQVVPLWTNMWNWVKNIWDTYIFPWLYNLWQQFLSVFGQEVEKRKPLIEQKFQKEKEGLQQELQEKLPEQGKTLWERIKTLLPGDEEN